MMFARLLSASISRVLCSACSRLMLGRKTWFTDWRKTTTMGVSTMPIENEASSAAENSVATTHWSARWRSPNSTPEIAKGARVPELVPQALTREEWPSEPVLPRHIVHEQHQ